MRYSIVYNSNIGNTAILADYIKTLFPHSNLLYLGKVNTDIKESDLLFVGFWTFKGCCDQETCRFLSEIKNKKIFLFGTAGSENINNYYSQILKATSKYIDSSNTIVGSFMCQGKMPTSIIKKMKRLNQNINRATNLILKNLTTHFRIRMMRI
ncbi:flavodoxin family protein [Streptococcus hongkongensis]